MSDTNSSNHLDSTIESLEHEIEKKSTTGASTSISSWIKTLSSHKELKHIADDLEKLKTAISEKNGDEIVKLLDSIGHETSKSVEKAEGEEADKVKKLGKLLVSSAKMVKTLIN